MSPSESRTGEAVARQVFMRFGYRLVRQQDNHLTLCAESEGVEHRLTIPSCRKLSVGTISAIISELDFDLDRDRDGKRR